MMKLAAILLLLNFGISRIQSRIIQYTEGASDLIAGPFFVETSPSSTSGPSTEGPASITFDANLWDTFEIPKSTSTSTTSTPADLVGQASTDHGIVFEKMMKITFAGRTNFRVRKNCRCVIHGRCAKNDDMCD